MFNLLKDIKEKFSYYIEFNNLERARKYSAINQRRLVEFNQSDFDRCLKFAKLLDLSKDKLSDSCYQDIYKYVVYYNSFARNHGIPSYYMKKYTNIYEQYNTYLDKFMMMKMLDPNKHPRNWTYIQ